MALAPRDPRCWVTKREGKWEESISCIAGSYPIVIRKAGVSSETPGCPCESATHTHKQSVTYNKVIGGRKEEEQKQNRRGQLLRRTPKAMTGRKKGVAGE